MVRGGISLDNKGGCKIVRMLIWFCFVGGLSSIGRGRLRARGSLFEKSSAKTFLVGTAVLCVIFGGEALASPPVREKYGQKKASFLLPVFLSDLGDSFRFAKRIPENDLDSFRPRGWGAIEGDRCKSCGDRHAFSQKVLAGLFP